MIKKHKQARLESGKTWLLNCVYFKKGVNLLSVRKKK